MGSEVALDFANPPRSQLACATRGLWPVLKFLEILKCVFPPFFISTTTTQDYCDYAPSSTILNPISCPSTALPPTPAGNLVPAIIDGIFPAHSGSRASPLRVLLRYWCILDSIPGTAATGLWRVSCESLCFRNSDPPPLARSEAALKWQRRRWQ